MYHKTVLENGVKILSEKMEHIRSISLGIWVGAGSRDEMERENGISHFVEHMIFKGTRNRSGLQIAKELDAIGGLSNAFTGKEHTCYHSKVLDKHLSTLAEILSDIFLNSIFDPQDMDRERQVILQEINMMEDTPEDRIHVLFNRLCWIDHPLGMCVLGTDETVSNIRKETILDYLNRFYTPSRIIITAAGNIDHDTLVAHFEPLFKSIKSGNEDPPRSIPRVHADISCQWKDLEQVHICLGGKAPNLSSDVRFAGAVLNTILGGNMSSRLFQEIREKRGLAYSLYSFLSAYMDTGLMGVYVGTEPSQGNQVLEIVNREIRKIRDGEVSKSDLSAAREHLMGGVLLGAENTDIRMMRLAKNDYVFGRYVSYDELVAKLQEVTVDQLVAVAQDTFQNDEVSLVTLGPTKREDLDLACLQFN
ncbi:MAG: pitrilysin family protein [Desulfobacteraceae bacterium]|jgi:predicted Zn-dependent peptidase